MEEKLTKWQQGRKSIVGSRYGRLTVLNQYIVKNKGTRNHSICLCDCGTIIHVFNASLKRGGTKSCGCLKKDTPPSLKHGRSGSLIYYIWSSMKRRCTDKKNKQYYNYGGRGISVCKEWMESFESFYRDMGDRPKCLSLDRIDNDGNYCKENCRWATDTQQTRNVRSNIIMTFNGETKCLAEWAEIYNINYYTLYARYKKLSMPVEKCLLKPLRVRK